MDLKLPLATALVLLVPGCDKQPEQTTPPTSDGGGADSGGGDAEAKTEPGAPGVPFDDKTFQQRKEYMAIAVLPAMKAMFKEYDANEFKQFKCQTCHGDDMDETKYEMPNESIYPLNKDDPVKAATDYDEKMTKFMVERVVPEMSKLLDEEPDATVGGSGTFGCMSCHPAE